MTDLVIIGGGPAGMSAAVTAYDRGIRNLLILERDDSLGGILQQCIHNGFGLHRFGEELTGPEYAYRYEQQVRERNIPVKTGTMVLNVSPDRVITASNAQDGIFQIQAGAVILAMGCRERPKGALPLFGTRPAGIYTAGTAQKLINCRGLMPGKKVVILGSGDIGLIMARRMTLEGAEVKMVCELMPYSGGLARNIQQCLNDFGIPLKLRHTVTEIRGKERVEAVAVAQVDEHGRVIPETKEWVSCDTLLLSVGLIPENELSKGAGVALDRTTGGAEVDQDRQTGLPGIFSCGNVLHVHDLVDFVSEEGAIAGAGAAEFLQGTTERKMHLSVRPGEGVRYTVPQAVTEKKDVMFYFRPSDVRRNVTVFVEQNGKRLAEKRRQRVTPGEMERITVKVEQWSDEGTLTIRMEETV